MNNNLLDTPNPEGLNLKVVFQMNAILVLILFAVSMTMA